MKSIPLIIFSFFILTVYGQGNHLTYRNYKNAYFNGSSLSNVFFESKINEITLNADSTFEFWSRPNISCFTWHQYKGTWKKAKDTILFYDSYEIIENDMRAIYNRNSERNYHITFSTDKKSVFAEKAIKVQYIYDFDAHLEDIERTFYLNANNIINIPFSAIPHIDKLAAIRIECMLNPTDRRYGYLTQNHIINKIDNDLPNVIRVEFVENPKKEIVYRTIKGVIKNDTLVIASSTKSKTTLPDYHEEIMFEDNYTLNK